MGEPQRVEMVEQLFHEALECDDAFRADFLAKACAGDVALLAEVTSLLASHERDQNFLQKSAFNLSALDLAGTVLGENSGGVPEVPRVKGFHLVREVGRGGMGAVYEAFSADSDVGQRVAVKVVKRGMDTEFVLRRFERERRILRALDHTYIARLLDGGATDEGLPFFVMEYVEGLPINRYVRETKLPITERLLLFLKVCEAVSYAHRHRVIHRDLKPSNILVTEARVPKLLDFGVAKLLDLDSVGRTADVTATAMAHRVMTPEYASPSQLRGLPPTEADDVYSLGLLLYILLTGDHPYRFRSRAPEEILRSIVEGRIRKPSEVVSHSSTSPGETKDKAMSSHSGDNEVWREMRGNLDKIVLKALHKEAERRYPSVDELADDIRRHLAGRPISARADSLAYRAARFAGRHPTYAVSTAAVALLCLLLGLVLGLSGTPVTPRTSVAVMPFSGEGMYSEQLAESITDGMIGQLSRLPQLYIPAHNSVYSYKDGQHSPQTIGRSLGVETLMVGEVAMDDDRLKLRVQLLDVGTGEFVWANTYESKLSLSEVLAVQGRITADVTRELGVVASAEELSHPARDYTMNDEAYRLYLTGRYFFNKRTLENYHKGIEYFRQAVEKDPSFALAYAGIADCYGLLGAYGLMENHLAFTSARDAANKALDLDAGLAEAHTSLALVHWLYDWDWTAADREFRKAIQLNPRYVTAHQWRGHFLGRMGRFDEAEAEMHKALALDPISAPVYNDYGRVLYWARRYDEALEKYQKASAINASFGDMEYNRELVYEQLGRLDLWAASHEKRGSFDAETREAYRTQGLKGYWTEVYRRAIKLSPNGNCGYSEVFARMGDKDRAFKNLEYAISVRDHCITGLKVNPLFDSLHSDPRFKDLLRRMNLTPEVSAQ